MATKKKKTKPQPDKTKRAPRKPSEKDKNAETAIETLLSKDGPQTLGDMAKGMLLPDRILSKTLARLKRGGKILFANGRWHAKTIKVCPSCQGRGWVKE